MRESMGLFESIWFFLWSIIKNSCTYRLIRGLYDKISGAWRKSRIADWFRRLHFDENTLAGSTAGRIVRSPFTFIEFLQRKFALKISDMIDRSVFISICRLYLNNLLGINLRFIGITVLAAAGAAAAVQAVMGEAVGMFIILAILAGAVLTVFDVNVTDCLKHSALVKLVCRLLDIDADFAWYEAEYTRGKGRFAVSAAAGVLFGIIGGATMPLLAPIALVGAAAVLLVLKKPAAGVYLTVFAAPIVPTMAAAGLAVLSVCSMILYALRTDGFKFKFDGIGFFVLVFIVIYLTAGITSFVMLKSLSIWAIYFAFMAMYFVVINTVDTRKTLNNLLRIFVISGFFVCAYGIAQYVFGWDTTQAWMDEDMFTDIKMRIYSTLGNPNVLGEYILLVLPVAIGVMWTAKAAAPKIVYAGISAMMLLALILTFSRGCWIGLMASAAIFVTFAAGKLWGLALIALPLIPMVLPESIINRFTSIGDMKDSSTSYRVYIWMGTLAMMKDFWISGIGMGQEAFTQVYPFYSYNGVVAPHSHNLFLQILVESGITGLLVFLLIMLFFVRRIMTGYQFGGKGAPLSTVMTAVTAGILGFLVQGMFDNCFYNYRVMLVFWLVIAMGRACVYIAEKDRRRENG